MADVITRLKLESGEYESKIKRATQGLLQMEDECRRMGGTLAHLEKEQLEFVKGLGKMQTVSTSVRGKLGELKTSYTELAVQYKRLTEEERKGDFGKALKSSLDQLKVRINDTKQQLRDVEKELSGSKFGQFGSIIDTIGQKMGMTANVTELLTSRTALLTGAVGAGATVAYKAAEAWKEYNDELARQQQITSVTTGLKGDAGNRMADSMKALSKVYGVDFREAVNAANTLMSQFGMTGDQAIQLLRDGMQGMIMGDGQKLLNMIQSYAPAFRDAGISASQLVAIIQNSEGGIFTDQNMNAIVMGIKNIRLMTNATSDALAKLGIDGQDMSKKVSSGTMTIFEALRQVSQALQRTEAGGRTAGEVMQAVFGRQGTAAGTNLAKAIDTLNTNLEETKKQTGEVGEAYAELEKATERLNAAMRECFGYDGYEQMATGIKTTLVNAVTDVVVAINKLHDALGNVGRVNVFETIKNSVIGCVNPIVALVEYAKQLFNVLNGGGGTKQNGIGYSDMDRRMAGISGGSTLEERQSMYNALRSELERKMKALQSKTESRVQNSDGSVSFKLYTDAERKRDTDALQRRLNMLEKNYERIVTKPQADPIRPLATGGKGSTEKQKQELTELQANQKKINALTLEYVKLGDESTVSAKERQAEIQNEIRLLEQRNGLLRLREENAKGRLLVSPGDIQKEGLSTFGGINPQGSILPNTDMSIKIPLQIDDKSFKVVQDQVQAHVNSLVKGGKDSAKVWSLAANAVSAVGSALNEVDDPAIKAAGTVAQAVASIALGFAMASSSANTAGTGWGWLAWLAAGATAMATTISTIHSLTGYAEGGIVKGNTYSGDQIQANGGTIGLNAGEVVLNKAQSGVLAAQLSNSGSGMNIVGQISGEKIVLVANRYFKRTGQGEIVTW